MNVFSSQILIDKHKEVKGFFQNTEAPYVPFLNVLGFPSAQLP